MSDLRTTARNPRHDDFYIVEFPKSGITWFSAIIANIALIESGRTERAGFVSARSYIPDIHQTRYIGAPVYSRPPQRMIKSHAEFNLNYNFVIYIVREPFSVMRSYHNYLLAHQRNVGDFSEFYRDSRFGVLAWKRHVQSWLYGPITGRPLHLVRYEDLLTDPVRVFDDLSANFSWNFERGSIQDAVTICRAENMQLQERFYADHNPRHKINFVKSKKVKIVDEQEIRIKINEMCREERKFLGYDED